MNTAPGIALPEGLIQRYFDGELDAEAGKELTTWLAASPEHVKAFAEQLEVHASLWENNAAVEAMAASKLSIPKSTGPRKRWRLATALSAACLLIGAGIAFWFLNRPQARPLGSVKSGTFSVKRGQRHFDAGSGEPLFAGDQLESSSVATLRLKDGSTVKLDAGASLTIKPTDPKTRADLALHKGRAFLRVAKAPGEFRVTGSAQVRVLGTVFGVEERLGRTMVNVLEGRVELLSGEKNISLVRGQSGAAARGQTPALTGADPNIELLWARELVRFENRPLGEVLDWIAANSSYRFEITEQQRSSNKVSVAIAEEPAREVIEALMLSCGLNYKFDKHDVKVR
jgi:ferric-dicitrate binding protein FerR (iron transport regulator)